MKNIYHAWRTWKICLKMLLTKNSLPITTKNVGDKRLLQMEFYDKIINMCLIIVENILKCSKKLLERAWPQIPLINHHSLYNHPQYYKDFQCQVWGKLFYRWNINAHTKDHGTHCWGCMPPNSLALHTKYYWNMNLNS